MIGRWLVIAGMVLLAAGCSTSTRPTSSAAIMPPQPTVQAVCSLGPPFAEHPGWSVSDAAVAVTLTNNGAAPVTVATADVAFTAGDYNVTSGQLHMAGGAQSYTLDPGTSVSAQGTLYDVAGEATYSPMPTACAVQSWS